MAVVAKVLLHISRLLCFSGSDLLHRANVQLGLGPLTLPWGRGVS